jgi:hypothetical protein
VRHCSADWHLWRRVVALTAAYAIALASIVASLGVARAAAETAAAPNSIICHSVVTGDEAPSPASNQSNHCADNCCIGAAGAGQSGLRAAIGKSSRRAVAERHPLLRSPQQIAPIASPSVASVNRALTKSRAVCV